MVSDWLSGRCFELVHGHHLVYNACWEDPRLDREALALGPDDVVVMITSAGCNALDYALDRPREIHCVDLNPRQNALLELKLAGIRELEFDDFFQLFGRGAHSRFPEVYREQLRPGLSATARRYWDAHQGFFTGQTRRGSFYFHGTTGLFAWLINHYIDRVARLRTAIDAILDAKTIDDQRAIYERSLRAVFWKRAIRWLIRRDTTLSLLGVPRPQRQQVEWQYAGGIARFVEDCVEAVFTRLPLADNYFWQVYLRGHYSPDCCPRYLEPDNFQRLKAEGADRIRLHTMSLTDCLRGLHRPVTRLVLLDHMDWLSTRPDGALREEWQAIVDRAAPGARLIWRSGGLRTDYVDRLQVSLAGGLERVGDLLRYHGDWAARLHEVDRVHTYGSFFIADLAV